MRRGLPSIAAAILVVVFAAAWHGDDAKSPSPRATASTSPTAAAGVTLTTAMAGANETPPVKSTGTGTAKITVDVTHNQVCWNLSVQKLHGTVTQAHIHRGPVGKAGPIVLGLSPPTTGSSHGCKGVGPPLARGIVKHPDAYYVNVHTTKFPHGEVRGQL